MNYVAWPAAYDSQVMLIRNTPWARGFFHIAAERRQDPFATAEVWLRRPRTLRLSCPEGVSRHAMHGAARIGCRSLLFERQL